MKSLGNDRFKVDIGYETKEGKIEHQEFEGTRTEIREKILTRKDLPAGQASIAFSGRIGKRALKPGTYRVEVSAKDAAGNRSKVSTARFRIVR